MFQDVLKLISCPPATLVLVFDGLKDSCKEGAMNILAEIGVNNLSPDQAIRVVETRIDLQL